MDWLTLTGISWFCVVALVHYLRYQATTSYRTSGRFGAYELRTIIINSSDQFCNIIRVTKPDWFHTYGPPKKFIELPFRTKSGSLNGESGYFELVHNLPITLASNCIVIGCYKLDSDEHHTITTLHQKLQFKYNNSRIDKMDLEKSDVCILYESKILTKVHCIGKMENDDFVVHFIGGNKKDVILGAAIDYSGDEIRIFLLACVIIFGILSISYVMPLLGLF